MRYKYKVMELGPEIPSINEETGGTERDLYLAGSAIVPPLYHS